MNKRHRYLPASAIVAEVKRLSAAVDIEAAILRMPGDKERSITCGWKNIILGIDGRTAQEKASRKQPSGYRKLIFQTDEAPRSFLPAAQWPCLRTICKVRQLDITVLHQPFERNPYFTHVPRYLAVIAFPVSDAALELVVQAHQFSFRTRAPSPGDLIWLRDRFH